MTASTRIAIVMDTLNWAYDFFRRDLAAQFPGYEFVPVVMDPDTVLAEGIYDGVWYMGTWWPPLGYPKKMCAVSCRSMRQFRRPGLLSHPGGIEGWLDQYYSIVTCNSEEVRLFLKPYCPDVRYLRTGIDTKAFAPGPERQEHKTKVVGWAGNRQPLKRVDVIAEAVADLAKVEFRTTERGQLALPWSHMPDWYRDLDVYVCASTTEGSCRSVLEAMACGVPVISTHVGEAESLIIEGQTGYFFDGTVDDLRAKLLLLLGDETQRVACGRNARDHLYAGWSWDVLRGEYEAFLDDLVTNGTTEGPRIYTRPPLPTNMNMGRLSVIMGTGNEQVNLGRAGRVNYAETTVGNLLSNTDYTNLEFVVVDDSTDGTCDNLAQDTRVATVRNETEHHGAGISRNLGAAYSSGDWLLFIDAHERFDRHVQRTRKKTGEVLMEAEQDVPADMLALATSLEGPSRMPLILQATSMGYDDTSSMCKPGCDWTFSGSFHLPDGVWTSREPGEDELAMPTQVLMGACYLMRRETLELLGGWLQAPSLGYNEAYLSTAALMCGVPLFTATRIFVRHLYEPTHKPRYRGAPRHNTVERQRLATHVLYDECRHLVQERAWGEDEYTTDREMYDKFGDGWAVQRAVLQQNRVLSDEDVLKEMGLWAGYYAKMQEGTLEAPSEGLLTWRQKETLLRRVIECPQTLAAMVPIVSRDAMGNIAYRHLRKVPMPEEDRSLPLPTLLLLGLMDKSHHDLHALLDNPALATEAGDPSCQ